MNGSYKIGKARTAEHKTHHLSLAVNDPEYEKIVSLSEKSGLTMSAVLRSMIRSEEIRPRPDVNFHCLYRVICSLESEVNLLTRSLLNNPAAAEDLSRIRDLYQKISDEIELWKPQWL